MRRSGIPNQYLGVLLHTMAISGLSRVRTELFKLLVFPPFAPHPVQTAIILLFGFIIPLLMWLGFGTRQQVIHPVTEVARDLATVSFCFAGLIGDRRGYIGSAEDYINPESNGKLLRCLSQRESLINRQPCSFGTHRFELMISYLLSRHS
jgi:hypothetical protein